MSAVTYSTKHPHEPEIPPALDEEGRCLVCGLLVNLERLERENHDLRQALEALLDHAQRIQEHVPKSERWYTVSEAGATALALSGREEEH